MLCKIRVVELHNAVYVKIQNSGPDSDMKAEPGERTRRQKKAQPLHGSVELFSGSIQDFSVRSVGLGPYGTSKHCVYHP